MSTQDDVPTAWLDDIGQWLGTLGGLDPTAASATPRASAAVSGQECRYCPVCQGLALLKQRHPEAHDHVTAAIAGALVVLRDLASGAPGAAGASAAPGEATTQEQPAARSAHRLDVTIAEQRIEVTD